jgi:uncharacterized membrane protein
MWFAVGLLVGAVILAAALWLRARGFVIRWYEWLLAVVGLMLLTFSLQNYWATSAEHWSSGTPLTFLLVFGIPGILFLLLSGALTAWRYFRTKKMPVRQ